MNSKNPTSNSLLGAGLFLIATVTLSSTALAATEIVVNGGFDAGFVFVDELGQAWADPTAREWNFNAGASGRIQEQSTGGNTGGYLSSGTGNDASSSSLYGVFEVSGITGNEVATFSFDILNNFGSDLTFEYYIWYADETASGSGGGFGALNANKPYGNNGENTQITSGSGTASANTGWNTAAVSETIVLGALDFTGNNVDSIGGWSDVNRISIGIQFNNAAGGIDTAGGIDNVSLTIIPEPSTYALLVGMFGLSWVMVRRTTGNSLY